MGQIRKDLEGFLLGASMRWFSFLLVFLLAACAQHPNSPQSVDSSKVKSILMAASSLDADTCAFEVEARGGKVRSVAGVAEAVARKQAAAVTAFWGF